MSRFSHGAHGEVPWAGIAPLVLVLVLVSAPGPARALAQGATDAPADPTAAARSLTPEQWRDDLAFLEDRIRAVHPRPFRYASEADFAAAVARLEAAIPRLSPEEVVVGLLRILALVRDGHTTMPMGFPGFGDAALERLNYHRLPVRLYAFEEGLFVTGAAGAEWADLIGHRVTAIDGAPVDSALTLAMAASPSDNRYGALDHAVVLLQVPQLLRGLGIADGDDGVTLTLAGDVTVRLPASVAAEDWQDGFATESRPLRLRHPDLPYWSEYLPGDRAMYVKYDVVLNRGERSIEDFFDAAFAEAEARGAERFVLDLRDNTGGNNSLNWPIIYDVIRSDRYNERGRVFVLIGRRTFSAAQNAVNSLERHTQAVFVGEPTAAHPNHYGDALRFTFPNSGLPFQVSALFWQHHPRDTRQWTAPTIFAAPSAEAHFAGRDPALEAIEGWDARPFFPRLAEKLSAEGIEAALAQYRAFRSDPRNRFVDVEAALNRLGYTALESGDMEGAVEVFRLAVEAYPESANAHDSFGEGLWRMGRIQDAIEQYERAVALDPGGFVARNAAAMLERIRAGESPP